MLRNNLVKVASDATWNHGGVPGHICVHGPAAAGGLLSQKARRTSLVWAAAEGHADIQGFCRTGPTSPLGIVGELALPLTN